MTDPLKIELELDINGHLARHLGYNEEGEPIQQPTTLEDVVLGMAAERLVRSVTADEAKRYMRERISAIRDEEIRAAIRPLIEEALTRSIQPTDHYGNPKGEPTTLAEVITKEAKTAVTVPKEHGYGKPKRTLIQEIIADAVDLQFHRELGEAIAEGKKAVLAAVRDEGAAVIQKTIERMAKA